MKSDPNFYVQFGKYFGDSLKYIGNQKEVNIIVEEFLRDDKPIDVRIGGCLAVGIKYFGKGDINCINLLRPLLFFDDDFVKSSACLSLGFGFLGTCNETVVEILSCIIKEEISVDVRKSAILGLGLVNLGAGSEDFIRIIFPLLKDPNWRIRAVAGLSLSFGCMGHGEKLFDKVLALIAEEKNPYVNLCTGWFISTAYAFQGKKSLEEYARIMHSKNPLLRDMACLGIGFANMGKRDSELLDALFGCLKDTHPYVRESSSFAVGVSCLSSGQKIAQVLDLLKDESSIVRSGVGLSLGLCFMGKGENSLSALGGLFKDVDSSVRWGASLGLGLAFSGKEGAEQHFGPLLGDKSSYVRWGANLGAGFASVGQKKANLTDLKRDINDSDELVRVGACLSIGCAGSTVSGKQQMAMGLMLPGIIYYVLFDSFWWGLWMLSVLGAGLWNDEHVI